MRVYYSCDLKKHINEFQKHTSENNILKAAFRYFKNHKIKNINIITFHRRHFFSKVSKIFGASFAEDLCKKGIYKYKDNYIKLINEKTAPDFNVIHVLAYLLDLESLESLINKYPDKEFLWIPQDEADLDILKEKYNTYNVYEEYK